MIPHALKPIYLLPLFLLAGLVLTGCERNAKDAQQTPSSSTDSELSEWLAKGEELVKQLEPIGQQVTDTVSEGANRVTSSAEEEVQKLFRWEYKVVDIPAEFGATETEAYLMSIGRDRWDCFHIEPRDNKLRAFCKRHPRTPLRYLPYLRNPF